uniref:Uncharacterized protein n=1 Tax=Arion vulgaris TaxID=1028688 RepID=A0A0B7BU65_9EUPU
MCHLENDHILPDTLGSYRPMKGTWDNAGTFAYDVYEGFQSKQETVAVAIDLEDAYNKSPAQFRFSVKSRCKGMLAISVAMSLKDWES